MLKTHLETLRREGLLDDETAENLLARETKRPFSLHWELNTLLWLGVLLLNIGLGILIYENIDTIGHAVLILVIGLVSAACFWYAWKYRRPFSPGPVETPTPFYDYLVMLGCFTFVVMLGYWQFQYRVFGERYGLATLIPTAVFFAVAFRFDHRGVLGLAITGLASWVGIAATPHDLLRLGDFDSPTLIYTGILFGVVVSAAAMGLAWRDFKRHFTSTWLGFTVHIFSIACLFAMIQLDETWLFLPVLLAGSAFFFWFARQSQSFLFLTAALIYGYIGFTYWLFAKVLFKTFDDWAAWFALFYFVGSCAGIILFLLRYKKLLKTDRP